VNRYFTYYIPFFAWIKQYKWAYLHGDLVAAVTMASFYIPMALSFASNLAHVPPINGLYSFVFNPIIYALLGSCPQMVVGPEAAGSLLLGSVVRNAVDKGRAGDADDESHARIAGLVTGLSGAIIFIAGLTRLGFLDSVLSRPFMRGFISSVGVIIIVDQLLTELGLVKFASHVPGVSHGSSIDKLGFIFGHLEDAHRLTSIVSVVSFAVIMVFREAKRRLQPRYPAVAYIPDRFLVVVLSAVLTGTFRWDKEGLEILGKVKSASGSNPFPFYWPFKSSHMEQIREAMGTSFLIALLGFFESSVAAKALGGGENGTDGIQGIQLSPNRELVALGVANLVGGCFMALPAFGGYGRSKVNASTGGKTPMSSIFLSIITIICILFLLPYFYYLPVSHF
jgi:MFS superfamily sulfate permease-like transporter